jgi:hypothetical protein
MPRLAPCLILALALTACGPDLPARPNAPASLARELVTKTGPTPPNAGPDACWADDVTPAIIETITEQVLVRAEVQDAAGVVTTPAIFETKTSQRIVQDRRDVWFRTPCEAMLTVDFVGSLQRALKARGFYSDALTGQLDAPTRRAIRQYQEPMGLDSERLSLAAARGLGIAAGEFAF